MRAGRRRPDGHVRPAARPVRAGDARLPRPAVHGDRPLPAVRGPVRAARARGGGGDGGRRGGSDGGDGTRRLLHGQGDVHADGAGAVHPAAVADAVSCWRRAVGAEP